MPALLAALSLAQGAPHRLGADEVSVRESVYHPAVVFSAAANAVPVDVRVLDQSGNSVATLGRRDFRIQDDGHLQVVASFSRLVRAGASDLGAAPAGSAMSPPRCAALRQPRSVLLYFDDLGGQPNELAYAREKLLDYLAQAECEGQLPAGETMGVIAGSGLGIQGFTADAAALRKTLLGISVHPRAGTSGFCPLITPLQAWEIVQIGAETDAAELAMHQASKCGACGSRDCATVVHSRAEEVWGAAEGAARDTLATLRNAVDALARQPGRRTLILTSSGFLTQDFILQQQQQSLIDRALREGVVIDALDAKALQAPEPSNARWDDPWLGDPQLDYWRFSNEAGGFSPVDSAMWEIAESTGGDFLHDSNDLRRGYKQDIEGPDVHYLLTFAPAALKFDGSFHRLKVKVTAPGSYRVAARYGYFAPSADQAPLSEVEQQKLVNEVSGSDRLTHVEVALAAKPASGGVHLDLRINPNTLALKHSDGRHVGRVVLVFALLTPAGQFVVGQRLDVNLHLTDGTLKAISRPGAGLPLGANLNAAPGTYRVRVVAFEPATGALGALSGKLQIAQPR
ncbi:MAG: VWA domain-containing protein [Terriglobales bacterium]